MFGERLRQMRRSRGWTQLVLAERVGLGNRHICRLEKGESQPNARTLERFAEVFGVPLHELLGTSAGDPVVDDTLRQQFVEIQELCEEDREAISRVLDAFLTKKRVEQLVQPRHRAGAARN